MTRTAARVSLAFAALAVLGGCGTLLNTAYFTPEEGGQKVFGGVRLDASGVHDCMKEAFTSETELGYHSEIPRPAWFALGTYVVAVDLPCSAVADTLTWPLILYWQTQPIRKVHDAGPCPPQALDGPDAVMPSPASAAVPVSTSRSP
jgi:uncharacterized protein YceK